VVLQEVGCGSMDWISLAQDRKRLQEVVSTLTKYRFPQNSRTFSKSRGRGPVSISGRTILHGVGKLVMFYVDCRVTFTRTPLQTRRVLGA
jgi:hypothetical protein